MIVRMSKYDFVLYSKDCDQFIDQLKDLGLVDITTSGWEPNEEDRNLLVEIENYTKAEKVLESFAQGESFDNSVTPYSTGAEAFKAYQESQSKVTGYKSEIARLEKLAADMEPWGDFSPQTISKIKADGVSMTFFVASESVFEANEEAWRAECTIEVINRENSSVYFVVVGEVSSEIDAQEIKSFDMTTKMAESEIVVVEGEVAKMDSIFSKAAKSIEMISMRRAELSSKLQEVRVKSTAQSAADGSLLVMEAWAEESQAEAVDSFLNSQDGLFYIKSNPTPEDNTPVKLKNNRYASLFELVGNLYALPKYGTIDLTPFFAPFYMLFFAICLCDAGYGAIIFAAGIALMLKGGESMRQASWLTMFCGGTAVIFGLLANSIFGMSFSDNPIIDFQKDFFTVSMVIGLIQILFGMVINIYVTARSFGFKYALGSVGWFLIIFAAALSALLTAVGVSGFGFDSIPFYAMEAIGLGLLVFFNSPDKNIFANFGNGIWETYNRATGFLGDILSYIRLFAIGLSGGVLALVFNDLAIGMTGLDASWADQSIVSLIFKILGATIILLIGHGINLFMSTISSFVHPMRLTFVEFYKNAGFEMSSRKFEPLKK